MDHIFTDNREDAMHNKSDPLCQHQSPHTDKKVIVCGVICYKMQEEFGAPALRAGFLASLPLLQCIQVILRSLLKSFFALPVLSSHILFILLKSVYPLP